MNKTILILDKEFNDYDILKKRLEQLFFIVRCSADYQDGIRMVSELKAVIVIFNFQLFLLFEKEFNQEMDKMNIPIIIVNSSRSEEDVLLAFNKGASDYITKPFKSREVEARVKAILRRMEITKSKKINEIKIGDLVIKPDQFELNIKKHKVILSKRELQVLLLLIDRKVISREELIRFIWGFDYYGGCRIVDMNISNLRRKIEINPKRPQYIKTIKGYGYRFDESVIKKG